MEPTVWACWSYSVELHLNRLAIKKVDLFIMSPSFSRICPWKVETKTVINDVKLAFSFLNTSLKTAKKQKAETCCRIFIWFYNWITEIVLLQGTWRTAVAQWLRCCATNRKVAGSIPAGVTGFFIDINLMARDRGSTVVKVLCYKSKGRWFDSSCCHRNFSLTIILPIALWPWGRLSL